MQDSSDATGFGENRTGMKASPALAKEMGNSARAVPEGVPDAGPINEVRAQYIREAEPLGSVPAPSAIKGAAKGASLAFEGQRPQTFMDKLAERLAYERGGARLYDAVIAKFEVYADELKGVSLQDLVEIRDEEVAHAELIRVSLLQLGADPTAQTPCADLVGVATAGFLQAAADPRTSLAQSLQVAVAAELVDVASWDLLISLAESIDQTEMANEFRGALERENEHLDKVRTWLETLTLNSAQVTRKTRRKSN